MVNEKYYNQEEVQKETIKYFKGDELATKAFVSKYALKSFDGKIYEKDPNDMHRRLAKEYARIESKYPNPLTEDQIFNLLKDFKYIIPGGSAMAGIGNTEQVTSLSNCFVIGNQADSYGGICLTDQEQVQLMKRRGGVGHDLSHIRPKSTKVNNSALTSTGIVPFMERYSNSTREVAQDGRRGALLLSCFAPSTYVYTDKGWELIEKTLERWYKNEKPLAWTHEGYKEIIDVQEIKDREIYKVECENGKTIEVTADHKFVVRNKKTNKEYLKQLIDIDVDNEDLVFYE